MTTVSTLLSVRVRVLNDYFFNRTTIFNLTKFKITHRFEKLPSNRFKNIFKQAIFNVQIEE